LGDTATRATGRGYARTVARVAVSPKNLLMRAQFLPPNGKNGG
jgi:hypothetical protein